MALRAGIQSSLSKSDHRGGRHTAFYALHLSGAGQRRTIRVFLIEFRWFSRIMYRTHAMEILWLMDHECRGTGTTSWTEQVAVSMNSKTERQLDVFPR